MELIHERFQAILNQYPATRYLVAYSGGLDSTVLLFLCYFLKQRGSISKLVAIHVNHGLHPEADNWEFHCKNFCRSLFVEFKSVRVDAATERSESPEEAARRARYQAFKKYLATGDLLLTAHHRDDQAETVLLQLLRGAGIQGLSGMAEWTCLGQSSLIRPLLSFPRRMLIDFARSNDLGWIEDSSNQDTGIDRNYLRHRIIPNLKKRWPSLDKTVSRSAIHCEDAKNLLDLRADEFLRFILDSKRNVLIVSKLKRLSDPDKRLVIRRWIVRCGYRVPSSVVLRRIVKEAMEAPLDRAPCVVWDKIEVNRFHDNLYLFARLDPIDAKRAIAWDGKGPLEISKASGRLEAIPGSRAGIPEEIWKNGKITIRFRQGGERCRLTNRHGTRTLKKLFQESFIPPWVRVRVPLVYIDDELAAVGDLWICAPFEIGGSNAKVRLRWLDYDLGWKSGDSKPDVD